MDVSLPDGSLIRDVPEGTTREQLLGKLQLAKHPAAQMLMQQMAAEQATADTSGMGKFLAGAGKAVADIGLGARQLVGHASQQEVDETKKRDAPLMDTGAGMVGNIVGNVGMAVVPGLGAAGAGKALATPALQAAGRYALSSPATLGGIATQGGMGALQSGLQPVATGESRLGNTAIGFAGGGIVPAAGMALKGGHAAVQPMYESGREAIMGRTLRRVAGGDAEAAAAETALRGARELVPGSAPTAGQAANNAGIAALERSAFAVEPAVTVPVANRLKDQNTARVAALEAMTGSVASRETADKTREKVAGKFYRQARREGVDPEMAQVLQPQIKNLTERMPSGVMERARELARINGDVMGPEGSISGLHWMKVAVDDLLSSTKQTGIGRQTERGLVQFKNDLLTVMDDLSPAYKKGREKYASLSRPINQMDVASEITEKSVNKLTGQIRPEAYARALSDDTAKAATGFNKATLSGTMEPQQMAALNAIKDDLARSRFAETAGRGVGSDTVQKMAYHNLMQQSGLSGLPNLLSRPVQLAEYVSRAAYGSADREMRRKLADALLDPQKTAELMKKGTPSKKAAALAAAIRAGGTPLGVGGTAALLDARQ